MSDQREIPAPCSYTVDFERKPVLYQADGKPLVRQAGFVSGKKDVDTGKAK